MNVVLTGSLAVDQIMNFDGTFEEMIQPDKLHVLSLSVLIKELKRTRGGIAGNIAYSMALLGEQPILFAAIGKEQREYIESLEKQGVTTSYVHYSDIPTATFTVLTDKHDCQVGGFYPGAMNDAASLKLANIREEALVVISANGLDSMEQFIDECSSLKKKMCFDVGQQVVALSKEVILKGLACAQLLILNDYEMGMLAKRVELSEEEIVKMVETCVITLGEKGSLVYTNKGATKEEVPAGKVDTVVDPTGAGDAFRAGFLYGYVRNWPSAQSAKLGSTVATFALEYHGTQEHTFTRQEVSERYQHYYQELVSL